jgi:hypothetical protein
MISSILIAVVMMGADANVGDITVRHVTTMTISNPEANKNLKEVELLHRHVLNQHFSALALGPRPDLIEPRLAQIIERESYVETPSDTASQACALDARRLCPNPEDKAALHCLGMADLKHKQPISDQCRTKVKLSIPYACSIEIDEHGCNGVAQSLLNCVEQNAKKISSDCADSLFLTKKFLSVWDSTKRDADARKAALTVEERKSKRTGNGMGPATDAATVTLDSSVVKIEKLLDANATSVTAHQGFTVARSSGQLISEKIAMDMVSENEQTQFTGGLILMILAGGISAWGCLFVSPRRLADAPAIVSVKEVQLKEDAPLLKFDDSSKSEVFL